MANRPAAALAKRESKQIRRKILRESFKSIRHLRHSCSESLTSQIVPDCSPPKSVSGRGVLDSSPTMSMQSSMDRCSAPKRVRRESVDPTGVKTRRQVAEAFYI